MYQKTLLFAFCGIMVVGRIHAQMTTRSNNRTRNATVTNATVPSTTRRLFPQFETLELATLKAAPLLDYSVLAPILIRAGVVLTTGTSTEYDYDILGPALQVAYAKARSDYNVIYDPINYLYEVAEVSDVSPDANLGKTQGCWMWNASGAAARAVNNNVQLIIGPACTDDMRAVNELTTFFRIPTITGAANLIDYTGNYDLLVRFGFNTYDMWTFVTRMCRKYDWTNVVLFYDTDNLELSVQASSLMDNMKSNGLNVYDIRVNGTEFEKFGDIGQMLLEGRMKGRVFVFALRGDLTRYFLVHATRLGMSRGVFVFFTVDLSRNGVLRRQDWKRRDGYDPEALEAFQHLTFYDAVLMFAMSVRGVLGSDRSVLLPSDMKEVVNKGLWNQTYNGASGTVYINPNGDRSDDLTLYYMTDTQKGTFSVVAQYLGLKQEYEELVPIPWRTFNGQVPPNIPPCGYTVDSCVDETVANSIIGGVVGGVIALAILVASIVGLRVYQQRARSHLDWLIEGEELQVDSNLAGGSRMTLNSNASKSTMSKPSLHSEDSGTNSRTRTKKPPPSSGRLFFSNLQGRLVMVVKCDNHRLHLNSQLIAEIRVVKSMVHDNVLRFLGVCIEPETLCVVGEYCSKASLQDLLADESTKLDWIFRFSLLSDIVKGLSFLHASALVYHGRLTSACCYVDGKFVLKVGDYGLPSFFRKIPVPIRDEPYYRTLFWTAPELLDFPNAGSQEGDVYSYGIMLQEIILREEPYAMFNLEPHEIIERIKDPEGELFRPTVQSSECPLGLLALMDQCWQHDPMERSRVPQIKTAIRQVTRGAVEKSNIVDLLLSRMEQYTTELEVSVEEKTMAFQEEKRKADALLAQILPGAVAEKLKRGESVPPETFDSATVFFSDIVGFQEISMDSTAIQIVDFLNDLYSLFDETIPRFDVYKVETIHDSYMMASGLPMRNGLNHAKEMGKLSLTLMHLIHKFKIRHRPTEKAKLRVGINTGPVVASVIGLSVPRYCLFGDTVNTASRMESTGEGLKIQITPATKYILDGFGGFEVSERGEIEVKGKGMMKTFWLLRELSGKVPGDA